MTEITDLQARLNTALARIGQGIGGLEAPAPGPQISPEELDGLNEALAAERQANAELQEKLQAAEAEAARQMREHQMSVDSLKQELQDAEIQSSRMRRTNTQLRQSIQSLRESAEAGVTEPHLINQAMMSELEGLRVAREGDRAEMDAILGKLQPLLEEDANA